MKLRLSVVLLAAIALLALPVWGQDVCQTVPGNEVWNCGFETGNYQYWTQSGNLGFTSVQSFAPYSGNYFSYMGPVGSDGFLTSNSFLGGNTLTFGFRQDPSFWGLDSVIAVDLGSIGNYQNLWYVQFALQNFGGPTNDFTVYWNGFDVGPDLVDVNAFPYTLYSGYLVGSSIPEPGTLVLMGTGLLGVVGILRRKMNL
jgi:hypothetical protein